MSKYDKTSDGSGTGSESTAIAATPPARHTDVPGTVLLVITRTANPDSAAISARALPLDVRASFAELLRMPTGGTSARAIRDGLGLTDYRFRKVRRALAEGDYLLHASAPVDGGWQHLYAVTDMAGTLPAVEDLQAMARRVRAGISDETDSADMMGHHGTAVVDAREDEPGQAGTSQNDSRVPGRQSGSGESTPVVTCDDAGFAPAYGDVEDRRVTGCGSPRRGEAEAQGDAPAASSKAMGAGRAAPVQPVATEPAKRSPLSVVGSLQALERLATLPERPRPANAGPLWVSNRGCLALSRGLDQNTVDAGLAVLGELELPFWFAPKTWALIESGWTAERLRELFTARMERARSVWSVCEKRLSAAVPDVPGGPPVDALTAALVPSVGEQIDAAAGTWDEPDPGPGAAPWDRPRSTWAEGRSEFWEKSVPGAPAYEVTRREMDAVDPGDPAFDTDCATSARASMRAALAARPNHQRAVAEEKRARRKDVRYAGC